MRTILRTIAPLIVVGSFLSSVPCQTAPPGPSAKPVTSLADSLKNSNSKQLHIIYVHGIAPSGPDDHDSWGLRKGICDRLADCLEPAGTDDATLIYADHGPFVLHQSPPNLKYFGKTIWSSSEEWDASAPFIRRWRLMRANNAPAIYVDEINWWPLVFAVKCLQIVEGDLSLVGPNKDSLRSCSKDRVESNIHGRFVSYPFVSSDKAKLLMDSPKHGALINRNVKTSILDWGFPTRFSPWVPCVHSCWTEFASCFESHLIQPLRTRSSL